MLLALDSLERLSDRGSLQQVAGRSHPMPESHQDAAPGASADSKARVRDRR